MTTTNTNATPLSMLNSAEHDAQFLQIAERRQWSKANPFARRLAARFRNRGGQYAPSTTTNAPDVLRSEPGVALARDANSLDPSAEPAPF